MCAALRSFGGQFPEKENLKRMAKKHYDRFAMKQAHKAQQMLWLTPD